MELRKFITDIPLFNNIIIQRTLDNECEKYYDKIERFADRFTRKLLLQAVNFGKAGTYELYKNKFPYFENFNKKSVIVSVLRLISLYHVMRFIRDNTVSGENFSLAALENRPKTDDSQAPSIFKPVYNNGIENDTILTAASALFTLDERERSVLADTSGWSTDFEIRFSRLFIEIVFCGANNSPVMLAFIDNFFYNSYNEFIDMFTSFVSI